MSIKLFSVNPTNQFRERQQIGFVTLNKNIDVKGLIDLAYDHQVYDKKSFSIYLFHFCSLLVAFFKYSLFCSIAVTQRIKSHKIFINFPLINSKDLTNRRTPVSLFYVKDNSISCLKMMMFIKIYQ